MEPGGPGGRGEMMNDGNWPWRAAQRGGEDEDEDEKNATRYFWIRAAVGVGGEVHFVYFILQEFN